MSPNLPHPFDDFLGHFLGVAEQHHGRRRHSDKTFKAGSADDAAFMMENAYRFYGREAARRIWTERSLSIPWVLHPPPCQPARKVALRQRLRSADDAAFMMENAYRFYGREAARRIWTERSLILRLVSRLARWPSDSGYSRSHAVTGPGAAAAALRGPSSRCHGERPGRRASVAGAASPRAPWACEPEGGHRLAGWRRSRRSSSLAATGWRRSSSSLGGWPTPAAVTVGNYSGRHAVTPIAMATSGCGSWAGNCSMCSR